MTETATHSSQAEHKRSVLQMPEAYARLLGMVRNGWVVGYQRVPAFIVTLAGPARLAQRRLIPDLRAHAARSLNVQTIYHILALTDILDAKPQGPGILLIEHDIQNVIRLCDRVTVMRNGQLVDTVNAADDDILEKKPAKAA